MVNVTSFPSALPSTWPERKQPWPHRRLPCCAGRSESEWRACVAGSTRAAARRRVIESQWARLSLVVDWAGEPVGATVELVTPILVFLRIGNRRAAVLAIAGPGAAVAVATIMKPLVGRTINGGFLSFPSGHTASATAFALVVTLVVVGRNPARAWLLAVVPVLAAAAMAWAQVLLNAHYPTDTIGGFCVALAVVPAVARAIDRVADRNF